MYYQITNQYGFISLKSTELQLVKCYYKEINYAKVIDRYSMSTKNHQEFLQYFCSFDMGLYTSDDKK